MNTQNVPMEMNESFKQRLLRKMYPLIKKLGKNGKNGTVLVNEKKVLSSASFYELQAKLNNGQILDFSELKGRKVLLVNTASNCGYTGQYAELQRLHEQMADKLHIIAFPANDFAKQEKNNDDEIASFCQLKMV